MSEPIRKVGVIGAGVMGSGIAAHLANAGIPAVLLDIVPPNLSDEQRKSKKARDGFAAKGLDNALKARPAAFFHKSRTPGWSPVGNLEDDLEKLPTATWSSRPSSSASTSSKVCSRSSRRSWRPRHRGLQHLGPAHRRHARGPLEGFRKRFLVLHFFNPVRYMKLLELVPGPGDRPGTIARAEHFGKEVLGKGIVIGKDTPNFVGNRIGTHSHDGHHPPDAGGRPHHRGRRRHHRQADGAPQERVLPHRRPGRHRHLRARGRTTATRRSPGTKSGTSSSHARLHPQMVEKKLLGNKTTRRLLQEAGRASRPSTGRPSSTGPRAATRRSKRPARRSARSRIRPSGCASWSRPRARSASSPGRCSARSLAYAARRIGEIADDVDRDRRRHALGLQLGARALRDLGRPRLPATYERMSKDGIDLPAR
jgi:3-hydroxyacyl-CoA dehydrogenase